MGSKSAIGIGNGICFKQVRDKGGGSYIDPLVRDSIVGLWKSDQNTNESPTRNIIKNTIKDKGGDLELLNFGYKLNSGYGGYIEDFSLFILSNRFEYSEISNTKVTITAVLDNSTGIYHSVTEEDSALYWNTFKIKVSGSTDDVYIRYTTAKKSIRLYNGINTVVVPNELSWHSFVASATNVSCNITLEFVPEYEGALVTDGKDDLIASIKTVSEMGITDEVTVVSMIHQVSLNSRYNRVFTNYLEILDGSAYIRNDVVNGDKTGIYGYTSKLNTNVATVINNILGDKSDYGSYSTNIYNSLSNTKFSVVGRISEFKETSSVAWYWTFIANKVLTTDQINQVISYFNLDKHVKPDVYYDVKKQGLSNDTPEADWYLKDFSGNGHDMQLYNFAKKLGSGIGKYEVDFNTWIPQSYVADSTYTSNKLHITNIKGGNAILYTKKGTNAMKVKITGIQSFNLVYRYIAENDVWEALEVDRDGIYELPASTTTTKYYTGFTVPYYTGDCDITIEQIPDYEGALVFDAVDDYGQFVGDLGLEDYTIAVDRAYVEAKPSQVSIMSNVVDGSTNTPFLMEHIGVNKILAPHSFGKYTALSELNINRFISYQSTYKYNRNNLDRGTSTNTGSGLTIGRIGGVASQYANIALWSLLLFPYSLSEFLLERQLKRYKLGTLYPGMIEWRPKVNINVPVVTPPTFSMNNGSDIITNGQYIPEGTEITIRIFTTTDSSVGGINEATAKINGVDIELSPSGNKTYYGGKFIVSSKQKIDITIDEYIRYENIVQPYPAIINLKQDGKTITWGDKLKVGSDIVFVESANLLPELYTVSETRYNGVTLYPNTIIKVEKSMVFDNARTYLKANEPSCILSPNRLRIPNSSYKILGYIPDLTGKGNHGRLNNFAYTEESGANEDGSIRFDGTDDHIIIPTIKHGGKALLMKVNWRYKNNIAMAYDQRINWGGLGISISRDQLPLVAYKPYNKVTYIDGIKNESVLVQDLEGITHNITGIYDNLDLSDERDVCISRTSDASNSGFADMSMYEFMLFPDVPNEEEIKELNDIVGIEGGYVESPNYYYDAYGKKNTDTDRNLIADQVSKDVANALEVKNVAYNSESGYTDDNGLLLDGVEDHAINTVIPAVTDFTVIAKRTDLRIIDDLTSSFIQKGLSAVWNAGGAFNEGRTEADKQYCSTFGNTNDISNVYNKEFFYETKNSYNGKAITIITDKTDSNGLSIGAVMNNGSALGGYWKGVFYKLMFYTKTIDQLSINMLKNLFERDELIDITNPIFKKKEL